MGKKYNSFGISLLSLPTTKKNKSNNTRRNINDLEATSAAHMLYVTDANPEEALIFCGRKNKAIPIIRQLVKQSERPFVFIGSRRDLGEESCLRAFDIDWETDTVPSTLSNGNGLLMLNPGAQTNLDLKINLSEWDSHFLIFCIGNGLQIDQELLSILNGLGHYLLISENLIRSIKCTESSRLTPVELLSSMDCILISSIGTSGKYLLEMLPTYECERITNATDFSLHHDAPHENRTGFHHRNGGGLRISQSKHRESRSILTHEDLMELQDSNTMLIHNTHTSHTWVTKVTN